MTIQDIRIEPTTVDPTAFRNAMGQVATPVTVVTARHQGRNLGTTVSAFASLSLEPAMVLVCLDKGSALMAALHAGAKVGINLLSDSQPDDALRFARKGEDKFAGAGYHVDHGLPRLDGTSGWLACEVADVLDAGDHYIVTAHVEHADHTGRSPMLYHNRSFGRFSAND